MLDDVLPVIETKINLVPDYGSDSIPSESESENTKKVAGNNINLKPVSSLSKSSSSSSSSSYSSSSDSDSSSSTSEDSLESRNRWNDLAAAILRTATEPYPY